MSSPDFTSPEVNPFAVKLHALSSPERRALWVMLDQLLQCPLDELPPCDLVADVYCRLVALFIRVSIGMVPEVGPVHHDN